MFLSPILGGFETFSKEFPEMCAKSTPPQGLSLPLSSSHPETADPSCSPCNTPLYDQVCVFLIIFLNELYESLWLWIVLELTECISFFSSGWSSGDLALPVPGQRLPRFKKRHAGHAGHHRSHQRLRQLPQPLRGLVPLQEHPGGGQPQGRHQLLVQRGDRVYWWARWLVSPPLRFLNRQMRSSLSQLSPRQTPIDDTDIRPTPLVFAPDLNFKKFPPKPTSWFGTGAPLLHNSGDIITTSQP